VDDTHLGIAIGIECSIMSNTAFVESSHPRRWLQLAAMWGAMLRFWRPRRTT